MDFSPLLRELDVLHDCTLCPRNCHVDRFSNRLGYCRTGAGFTVSSICVHRGEEPVISGLKGICNLFFAHCNLQCSFCQNHQISDNRIDPEPFDLSIDEVVRQITGILDQGIPSVGFVSPSHMIPQVKVIVKAVKNAGYNPIWVYNSNGYDKVETLRELEGMIDVYLPDLKYIDPHLAKQLSDAEDYPRMAGAALKEMLKQQGTTLRVNDDGYAESGLLIRHLVLPGHIGNSLEVLRFIADELSPSVYVALMSQYYPAHRAITDPHLSRSLSLGEYATIVKAMEELGLERGFIQELESFNHYRPDFDKNHPFEHD